MSQPQTHSLAAINAMDRERFVEAFGSCFEHAPWVADGAWAARPFAGAAELHDAMFSVVQRAPKPEQVAFLCGHPELAGKEAEAGTMTSESVGEQASAGLDALSRAEIDELRTLNAAYLARHGFPFIIAVRRHTKAGIFEQLRRRVDNDTAAELQEALAQIGAITRIRVEEKVAAEQVAA